MCFPHAQVPLIIRCPWKPAAVGARTGALTELLDLFPTVSSLLGAPPPDGPGERSTPLEGRDVSAILDSPEGAAAHIKDAAFSLMPRCPADGGRRAPLPYTGWCRPGHTPAYVGYSIRTLRWRYTAWVAWRRVFSSEGRSELPWAGGRTADVVSAWEQHVALWRDGPDFEELYYFPPPREDVASASGEDGSTPPMDAASMATALRDASGWLAGLSEESEGASAASAARLSMAEESRRTEECLFDFNLCEPVNLAIDQRSRVAASSNATVSGFLATVQARLLKRLRAYFECQHEHACIHPAPPPPPIRPEPPLPPTPSAPPPTSPPCYDSERVAWCQSRRAQLSPWQTCSPWLSQHCEKTCGVCSQLPPSVPAPLPPPKLPPWPKSPPPSVPSPGPTAPLPRSTPSGASPRAQPLPTSIAPSPTPPRDAVAASMAELFVETHQYSNALSSNERVDDRGVAVGIEATTRNEDSVPSTSTPAMGELGRAGAALLLVGMAMCALSKTAWGRRCEKRWLASNGKAPDDTTLPTRSDRIPTTRRASARGKQIRCEPVAMVDDDEDAREEREEDEVTEI